MRGAAPLTSPINRRGTKARGIPIRQGRLHARQAPVNRRRTQLAAEAIRFVGSSRLMLGLAGSDR
jgi:hypothetical protein